ncbi:MAG: cupin domain-containing protein [Paracoccaceae bacterium]
MTQRPEKPDPAEYLLGLSDREDKAPDFEAEIADWAAWLSPLDDEPESALPDTLWSGIEARLTEAGVTPGIRTIQPDAGVWECITPGVERKIVHQDPSRRTLSYFLRLRTGAVLPEHDHPGDEHCVVLTGTLQIGDTVFAAGSYQFAAQGMPHPIVTAQSPALVFIHTPYQS